MPDPKLNRRTGPSSGDEAATTTLLDPPPAPQVYRVTTNHLGERHARGDFVSAEELVQLVRTNDGKETIVPLDIDRLLRVGALELAVEPRPDPPYAEDASASAFDPDTVFRVIAGSLGRKWSRGDLVSAKELVQVVRGKDGKESSVPLDIGRLLRIKALEIAG